MPRGACVLRYDGKRGVVWRIKYTDANGVQVKETIGAEADGVTRKQAEAELRERLVRVERTGYRRPRPLTFGQYAQTWLEEGPARHGWKPQTAAIYGGVLDRYLLPAFGTSRLESIRPRDVAAFIRDMSTKPHGQHQQPLSPRYVNLLLNVLHAIYQGALGEELVRANPVVGVTRPKVIRRHWRLLEPAEVVRVLKAFEDGRARIVFMTLTLAGLRRSELQALRWGDVNLLDATLRVTESKTEEGERLIAVAPALADALAAHYAESRYRTDNDFVFAHPERGSKLDAGWYAGEFRKALASAGITDYIRPFHDARHGALTNLAAAGVSPMAIMGIAGHRSMSTTQQYIHLAGVVFRDEAAALERRLLGVQTAGTNSPLPEQVSQSR